jgi:hypothetical protein
MMQRSPLLQSESLVHERCELLFVLGRDTDGLELLSLGRDTVTPALPEKLGRDTATFD